MQKTERNWHTFNTQNKKGQRLLLLIRKRRSWIQLRLSVKQILSTYTLQKGNERRPTWKLEPSYSRLSFNFLCETHDRWMKRHILLRTKNKNKNETLQFVVSEWKIKECQSWSSGKWIIYSEHNQRVCNWTNGTK